MSLSLDRPELEEWVQERGDLPRIVRYGVEDFSIRSEPGQIAVTQLGQVEDYRCGDVDIHVHAGRAVESERDRRCVVLKRRVGVDEFDQSRSLIDGDIAVGLNRLWDDCHWDDQAVLVVVAHPSEQGEGIWYRTVPSEAWLGALDDCTWFIGDGGDHVMARRFEPPLGLSDGELGPMPLDDRGWVLAAAEDGKMPDHRVQGASGVMDHVPEAHPYVQVVGRHVIRDHKAILGGRAMFWLDPHDKGMVLDMSIHDRYEFIHVSVCPSNLRVDTGDPAGTLGIHG